MGTSAKSGNQVVRNRRNPRAQKGQPAGHVPGTAMPASPSPGPSGLPFLRTSERGTFKRCRWKWWQEFHDVVKPAVDVPPLRFGTLIHEALAAYYKPGIRRGPKPATTFEQLYLADLAEVGEKYDTVTLNDRWDEAADLGIVMLERYYDKYHPDAEWKVLVTEYPFQTIVPHPRDGVTPWFWYTGILDGLWENRGTKRLMIPDHKTTASIQTSYLRMDDQATSYWTFGVDALMRNGLIAPNGSQPVDGVMFNFLRKANRDGREQNAEGLFLNLDGSVSKKQPSPYHQRVPISRSWSERESVKKRVIAEFLDMSFVRNEHKVGDLDKSGIPIAAYKNPSQFTCNGCWALDMCELHEIGQDWEEFRSMTTRSWDPYAAHEIREGR